MNTLKMTLAATAVACFSIQAYAAGGNGGEQGSANGQPFQSLQEQIDQTNADLDALAATVGDQGQAIADLQTDVGALQMTVGDLQAQITANDGDIADITDDIADLLSELATKQDILDSPNYGCPAGSHLRVIEPDGSILCEDDVDTTVSPISRLYRVSAYRLLNNPYYQYSVNATCPSGWFTTGGGYEARINGYRRAITVSDNRPVGANRWYVNASRGYAMSYNYVRAWTTCVRNYH